MKDKGQKGAVSPHSTEHFNPTSSQQDLFAGTKVSLLEQPNPCQRGPKEGKTQPADGRPAVFLWKLKGISQRHSKIKHIPSVSPRADSPWEIPTQRPHLQWDNEGMNPAGAPCVSFASGMI